MQIVAIYQHPEMPHAPNTPNDAAYACFFDVPEFDTHGANCDTPEIEALLVAALNDQLYSQSNAFYRVGLDQSAPLDANVGTRVKAFYSPKRAKALIERPIVLGQKVKAA